MAATALFLFDIDQLDEIGWGGYATQPRLHVLGALAEGRGGWTGHRGLIRGCQGDLFPYPVGPGAPTLERFKELARRASVDGDEARATSLAQLDKPNVFVIGLSPLATELVASCDNHLRRLMAASYLGVLQLDMAVSFREISEWLLLVKDIELKNGSARGNWGLDKGQLQALGLKRGRGQMTPYFEED